MQLGAGDGHDGMGIVQLEFRGVLVQFGVQQPRIRNEPAAGRQMERDAMSRPGMILFIRFGFADVIE